jgi:hypothetical protein
MDNWYIVVSREGEDKATIQCLRGKFNGNLKSLDGTFREIIEATEAIEHDLERRGMRVLDAIREAYRVAGCQVGAFHHYPDVNMYYRVLEADLTSDGKPIMPGLRVLDYDHREGAVEPGQFMDDGMMCPGGEHFDGWYYVVSDGETGRGKPFNGERMKAL